MKPLIYLILLPFLLLTLAACDATDSSDDVAALGLTGAAETDEEATNNLSFPVIWGDQVALPLSWFAGKEMFHGAYFVDDDDEWFVQQDPMNKWQAESAFPPPVHTGFRGFTVDAIDWGDNLEARDWTYGRPVRVEVALFKALDKPMMAYTMRSEDPTVHGPNEVWGTNGVAYYSDTSMVYSAAAQLVIQKITKTRDDPSLNLRWTGDQWIGDVEAPIVSQGIWEDTHEGFTVEVNAKGRVIYGFNWRPVQGGAGAGDYRITFVLQRESPVRLGTFFDSHTNILVPDEEGPDDHPMLLEADARPGTGGTAEVAWRDNLTYIDVRITGGPTL